MKNLNEPHEPEKQSGGQVISLESRRGAVVETERPLIAKREIEALRTRWTAIQASFVDEPRKSVQDADELVSSAIKHISEGFRDRRSQLEKQWSQGTDASTEDLRIALQHYRTFFDRLLSM